ncbi:MAG: MBL fold metallo-hydrolase [Desulfobacteraceae bacterium]|nr:MBL fold metallo-hydrolase [Desulfobacteraceae bacterium]
MINITTLCENTASVDCIAEWGLSILIDVDGFKILFDTGGGLSIIHNAQVMGVNFSDIDKIVLSHGHFDHTGGLSDVLKLKAGIVDVIAHPDIWTLKYSCKKDFQDRYIGMQYSRAHLEGSGARFKLSKEPIWINDNIVTSGEIPMLTDYENIDNNLFVKEHSEFKPDFLGDDLSLGIKTEAGLIIILGCSHRGMINNIKHLQKVTNEKRVFCVVGGTHLMAGSNERILKTIEDLKKIDIQKLGVSHCTGFMASSMLFQHFPNAFFNNNAGTEFVLPY